MRLRSLQLVESREKVLRIAHLRRPQREAFDVFHELIRTLDDRIGTLSSDRILEQLTEAGFNVPVAPPHLIFHLATGVGKTRLLGSIIAHLYRSGESRNCLILASRRAILEKFERECQVGSQKYLFVDASLVPQPNTCFRSNLESFRPKETGLNLFVLSPQSIRGSDRRFARRNDFQEESLQEYLARCTDLVVFTDESHHLAGSSEVEAKAWIEAIRDLSPKVHLGFTATPRDEDGANVLYRYDLAECLQEGLYTKAVQLWVQPRTKDIDDVDWDHVILDYALDRLKRKQNAILAHSEHDSSFPPVEPVLLVCARDTNHAEEIATWLKKQRGLDDSELLVTHSQRSRTEEDIARLIGIDSPQNRIRVVINVFQLTEGWDVTNVYVIAPLRAMATFQGAVQSMGRGLRLPAGKRVENVDVDTLDVLCFGKESMEEVLDRATTEFGSDDALAYPVSVAPPDEIREEDPVPVTTTRIAVRRDVEIDVPTVRRIPADPPLDFDPDVLNRLVREVVSGLDLGTLEKIGAEETLRYSYGDVLRIATARILSGLPYLSAPIHAMRVSDLVRRLLEGLGAEPDAPIAISPLKLALALGDEIDKRNRRQDPVYEVVGKSIVLVPNTVEWRVPEDYSGPLERVAPRNWE